MKKSIRLIFVLIGFVLVTFFGLGPVMFADGGIGERIATLAVVIVLYAVLTILFKNIK